MYWRGQRTTDGDGSTARGWRRSAGGSTAGGGARWRDESAAWRRGGLRVGLGLDDGARMAELRPAVERRRCPRSRANTDGVDRKSVV